MNDKLNVTSNPHVREKMDTSKIMLCVIIALIPATVMGIVNFGYKAAILVCVCIATCVLSEWVFEIIIKKKSTIKDLSAVVTGLLLAMNLPHTLPIWQAIVGSVFAIVIVKMLFGGLGQNFMNPALGGRCFLLISFTGSMTSFADINGVTGATPLALLKAGESVNTLDMLTGRTLGTIGETSVIAIIIGAIFLILMGIIDLKIPGSYIVSFSIFVLLFGGHGLDWNYLVAHLCGGGLMLGAFFMATDYVTRPITKWGQFYYGILLGALTAVLRVFGPSAEGVSYAIIIGNLLVPLIDRIVRPRFFGKGAKKNE